MPCSGKCKEQSCPEFCLCLEVSGVFFHSLPALPPLVCSLFSISRPTQLDKVTI
jgi:hypothetical protein